MNRRTFLETSAAAALAASIPAWARSREQHHISRIGVQLYTVRDEMQRDFEGTLAKVAAIGYREVEFAGYFDQSPKAIRGMLDRHGLAALSAHVDSNAIDKQWPQILEAAHVVGHKYIVCSSFDETQRDLESLKRAVALLSHASVTSRKAGIQLAYHNHDYEFQPYAALGGKTFYDFLLAETDPKLVQMQMDLCWITVGGQDPLAYFDRYPGRFPLVHVKDILKDHQTQTDVGKGTIDWKRIFAQSGKAGIRHYYVEHDEPPKPLDSIRASYEYLRDLRF